MKWTIWNIPIEDMPTIIKQLQIYVQSGNSKIEEYRCVYIEKESDMIYMLTAFDFLDLEDKSKIKKFHLCQMVKS